MPQFMMTRDVSQFLTFLEQIIHHEGKVFSMPSVTFFANIFFTRFALVLVAQARSAVAWEILVDRLCVVINHLNVGFYMGQFLGEVEHAVQDIMNSQYSHVSQSLSTG